ncbi:hypothetical protein [Streptomyces sp. RerS4]|uniref:hypothetical protein n=1 Tax=Streptomyces sp. RerS4 TaxID=2942449 RepID=UPI00201C270D|nr:hypothetical protein [Streptomyces sp. RerS4]UQX01003.1 hypothetical protein M4D82_11020 [Streptomyces sp. RerS4]
MTSKTSSTPATGTSAAAQGSHMWVLTLELPGRTMTTQYGTWTPPADSTRYDVFVALRGHIVAQHPEMANANCVFFSLEPNGL